MSYGASSPIPLSGFLSSSLSQPGVKGKIDQRPDVFRRTEVLRRTEVYTGARMVCFVCSNPDGPCRQKTRDCKFFITSLPEHFNESLDSIDALYNGRDEMLCLEGGTNANFCTFDILKTAATTSIAGEDWSRFLIDFKMKAGDMMLFEMESNADLPMRITPMDVKCKTKYRVMVEHTVDVEEVYQKHSVVVITRKVDFTNENRLAWKNIVLTRGVGIGPIFIHKLTPTNVNNKVMKIPRKVVAGLNLELPGHIRLWGISAEPVIADYTPCTDGRMLISDEEWGSFIETNGLDVGQTVKLLFYPYEDIFEATRTMHITVDAI